MKLNNSLLLAAAFVLAAVPAFADNPGDGASASGSASIPLGSKPRPGIGAACRDDAQKLCKGAQPGDGALLGCLKKNQSDLSEGCSQAIAEARKKFESGPCAADTQKFCAGMTPGDGKWGACMEAHKADISGACTKTITKVSGSAKNRMAALKKGAQDACGADAAKLCPGTTPGDGKFGPCLSDHQDQLSDSCKNFIAGVRGGAQPAAKSGGKGGEGKKGGDDDSDSN